MQYAPPTQVAKAPEEPPLESDEEWVTDDEDDSTENTPPIVPVQTFTGGMAIYSTSGHSDSL